MYKKIIVILFFFLFGIYGVSAESYQYTLPLYNDGYLYNNPASPSDVTKTINVYCISQGYTTADTYLTDTSTWYSGPIYIGNTSGELILWNSNNYARPYIYIVCSRPDNPNLINTSNTLVANGVSSSTALANGGVGMILMYVIGFSLLLMLFGGLMTALYMRRK